MSQLDPELTDEQRLLARSVRDLFEDKYDRDYVRDCDRERRPPVEAFTELGQLGYLGINIAKEFGGGGGGAIDLAVLLEELGRGFLDLSFWAFRNLGHGAHGIGVHGTPEQRQRLLPALARGEISVCFALTEPDSGSDAAAISTAAVPSGDSYRVTGEKIFCSGFKVSDFVLTATRTGHGGRKHEGITLLLIPTDAPGLTWRPLETLGHWPLGTALVHFEDVEVSAGNRLGPQDEGWPILMDVLEYERLCLSAARTGAAQAALRDALAYAKQRHQFGQPIGKFQAISHKLAEMQVLVDISRMLVYRFAGRLDAGTNTVRDAATLKLFVSEAYKSVADMGMQILGGYGYTMEYDLQRHLRESRLGTIGAGTSEIQRNIIAKTMGL
ncbi:MAG TPA: acyl-CoA dehydrogenase family protein [Mycobacteriales bacterium]|nr:acyl-CoA dehydrogenase family protein [Mycobacteriales bacterium]